MKSKNVIIFLALFTVALLIIFIPKDKTHDLDGYWMLNKIIIDSTTKPVNGTANFYGSKLVISGEELLIGGIEEAKFKLNKDTLQIISKKGSVYNGTYKINITKKLVGSGDKASFNIELLLISNNKSIVMNRTEPVKWYRGLPRGRP
jgi:hypothetical protein